VNQRKSAVILGAQWGDEGKGKIVDVLSERFSVVARYAGGHNAGHTVIIKGKKFVLQLIPCGVLRPECKGVIGNGVVLDPMAFLNEVKKLKDAGLPVDGQLFVSNRAQVILPYHRMIELAAENAPGRTKIGTTSRGIGPAYEDKMHRSGLRVVDLLNSALLRTHIENACHEKNTIAHALFGTAPLDPKTMYEEYARAAEQVAPFVTDTAVMLNHAIDQGEKVMFEGAQGALLDIDHGTYPFVTSSSAISGGATTGVGVAPSKIKHVLGISKAYTTRVGSGPFPTEMPDLDAQELRKRGKEFGAVTGRPRRCGWLDLAMLRYSKMINGIDSLVVTKLDVFDTQREIQVCVGYKYKGTPLTEMPALAEHYEHVTPEYKTLPGWCESSTYGVKDGAKLPPTATSYLRFISDFLQVEIGMISTGPERDATIVPEGTLLARWL
jgi:adenylosuccinate synthase